MTSITQATLPTLGDVEQPSTENQTNADKRRQRNMSKMEEQEKTPELNKMKASNLPDTGYKEAQ